VRPDSASFRHEVTIESREPGGYIRQSERHDRLGASLETPQRRLVIFDCDGVLVDSEILACNVQARAVTDYGLPLSGAEVAGRFLGMSARDMRASLEADLGRPLPSDHEARCAAELFALFRRELKPVKGMTDVVAALCAADHPRCVASSSSPERITLALEVAGLHEAFRPHVFSASMVARGKPAPDLFLHAANLMGFAANDCIVIEDSANGVRAARSAGMLVIGFLGGTHCPPGHGESLAEAGAQRICRDADELAEALSGLAGVAAVLPAEVRPTSS
jgi:HAD superfamily hydrolase (TIGR01509 family)